MTLRQAQGERIRPIIPFVVSLSNHERPFEADRSAVLRTKLRVTLRQAIAKASRLRRQGERIRPIIPFAVIHTPLVISYAPFVVSLSNLAIGESVARVASGDLWRHEWPFEADRPRLLA